MRAPLFACLASLAGFTFAQQGTVSIPGHPLQTPPTIDGRIDEAAEWKDVPSFEGLYDTQTGSLEAEGGKFWLAYDEKFIYFAARMVDTQPSQIAATEYRTNANLRGNDVVALVIDPFGALNDFSVFRVNPRGATDIQIAGGRAAKREWLGDIYSQGRITDTGWEVEARIPWSILRLPGKGVHDLRFNFYRYHRRRQRESSWVYTEGGRIQQTPKWTQVVLPAGPPKTLKLLPFTYMGVDEDDGFISNSGLDLKTSITDQLEFVGTINPDFRNIENDILSLDFSYFERIADESRPFFLEGGEYFQTSNDAPIFLSQRIDRFDFGAKVYGKLDDTTDLALLHTADFGEEGTIAFNARRQITPRSAFRVAYSGLDIADENIRNSAFHTEYRNGIGAWEGFAQFAGTTDRDTGEGLRHNTGVVYNNSGLNGVFEFSSVTENFNPRLGFAPQRGFRGLSGSLDLVRPFKSGPIMEDGYSMFWRAWDTFGGDKYLHEFNFFTSYTLRDGTDLDTGIIKTEFGGFDDTLYFFSLEKPRGDSYRRWQIDYLWGDVQNEDFRQYALTLAYRPMERFQLNASYERVEHFDSSDQIIFSGNYDLGNDRSISGRAVSRGDDWNAYLAYRRSGNAGMEYFVILGDPNADKFRSSLILKVTYPLEVILGRR